MELEDQEFEMRNFEPVTIVLDEPDFATIARYASEKEFDKKFIEDLIAIANYVANLSSLKSLNEIKVKPLESFIVNGVEQITIFFNDVIHKAKLSNAITDDTLRNLFIQYLQTVKNKLIGVVKTGANAAPQEKLDNIHVLFTNNTARKFDGKDASASNYTGGWESHSKRVTNLDPNGMLQDQDHMNLIKGENAVIIAQQIKDIVKKELNPIELFKSNIFKEARGLMEDGVDPVEVQKAVTLIFFGLFKPRVETAAVAITQPNNMLGNLNDTLAISPTDLANSDSENPSILSIAHRQSPIRLGTAK